MTSADRIASRARYDGIDTGLGLCLQAHRWAREALAEARPPRALRRDAL
jgi:hypothetical protein